MKKIHIDGSKHITSRDIHKFLAKELNFPEHYGCNLDALYDELSTYNEKVTFTISNTEGHERFFSILGNICMDIWAYEPEVLDK